MDNNMVTIPIEEYVELRETQLRFQALESAGVDNWEGYTYAMRKFDEDE